VGGGAEGVCARAAIVGGELYPKIANLQSNKGPSDCDVSKVCRLKAHIK